MLLSYLNVSFMFSLWPKKSTSWQKYTTNKANYKVKKCATKEPHQKPTELYG